MGVEKGSRVRNVLLFSVIACRWWWRVKLRLGGSWIVTNDCVSNKATISLNAYFCGENIVQTTRHSQLTGPLLSPFLPCASYGKVPILLAGDRF